MFGSSRVLPRATALASGAALLAACASDPATAPLDAAPATTAAGPALHTSAAVPSPALAERLAASAPRPSFDVASASLVANGPVDVLWHQTGTGNFGVWYMDGTSPIGGSSGGWAPLAVSAGWEVEAAADFDGDGDTDLLFHQSGTSHFGIWLLSGATLRASGSAWLPLEASAGWEVADAADFDADGKPDLLWRNPTTGGNGIWLMNGTAPRSDAGAWVSLQASPGWHVDAAASLDGTDAMPDVVWHRTGTGELGVWRMNGTTPIAAASGGWSSFTASSGWEPIDAADFDGDLRPDLLWRGPSGQGYGVWLTDRTVTGAMRPSGASGAWIGLAASAGWEPRAAADFGAVSQRSFTVLGTGSQSYHLCGAESGGATFCGGTNSSGQVGDGTTADRALPVRVLGLTVAPTRLALGAAHTCALVSARVWCWGRNSSGQLGAGDTSTAIYPTAQQVPLPAGTSSFTAVAAGDAHTCAVANTGQAFCWGSNALGQLGTGSLATAATVTPQAVPFPAGVTGFRAVAAGKTHACAVTTAGAVHCWGNNRYGQLGVAAGSDPTADSPVPTPQAVAMPAGVTSFGAVTAGEHHTCALADAGPNAGRVYCWGRNELGQLGTATNAGQGGVATPAAQAVPLPAGVTAFGAVVAGAHHNCALAAGGADAGRVYCWGYNGFSQLGVATNERTMTPTPTPQLVPLPPGVTGFTAIGAGWTNSCAITAGGVGYCWGSNVRAATAVPMP